MQHKRNAIKWRAQIAGFEILARDLKENLLQLVMSLEISSSSVRNSNAPELPTPLKETMFQFDLKLPMQSLACTLINGHVVVSPSQYYGPFNDK